MPFRSLLFFLLAILSCLLIFLYFDSVTSIVPGWHTIIYKGPNWFQVVFPVMLLAASWLYRTLSRKGILVTRALFWLHVLFTILPYLYANFGLLVFKPDFSANDYKRWMFLLESTYWCQWLSMIMQAVFIVILVTRLFSKPPHPTLATNS